MAEEEKETFEGSLRRLEEIVSLLEKGEAPLEEGLKLFEEGVALSRRCQDLLEAAERRIERLVKEKGGGLALELFPRSGDDG